MSAIMSEEKKSDMDKVTPEAIRCRYFPKSYTPKQMEQTIIKLGCGRNSGRKIRNDDKTALDHRNSVLNLVNGNGGFSRAYFA